MADVSEKKDEGAKVVEAPKVETAVKEDIASDPDEDDLSDLDGGWKVFFGRLSC